MTDTPARHVSRRSVVGLAALAALVGPMTTTAHADATFPQPSADPPLDAIRSYEDMLKELDKIRRTSRYGVTVRTLSQIGTGQSLSEQGRELYVATVGTGARAVWVQGRIHGNEPYGLESILSVLKQLGNSGAADMRSIRDAFTVHFIPVYNPDGSEANIRETILWDRENDVPRLRSDGREQRVDLNRDWRPDGFVARESLAWYEYWAMVKPAYALDIHHQGLKRDAVTGEPIAFSLGISLAPGGPTLPGLEGGDYDVLTRQMAGHVWQSTRGRGYVSIDRYDVGNGLVIDIRGGVVSAMMLGLDHAGLNPTRHSNPAIFFETSGNTRDGSIGQKARGKLVQQNIVAQEAWLSGLADGTVRGLDPEIWEDIPHAEVVGYFTDWGGVIPV